MSDTLALLRKLAGPDQAAALRSEYTEEREALQDGYEALMNMREKK